jgi:hypothetical protein
MPKSTPPRPASTRKPRATKAASSPAKVISMVAPPLDPAMVAARAYELFVASGGVHGYDVEHWLQAERELLAGRLTTAA